MPSPLFKKLAILFKDEPVKPNWFLQVANNKLIINDTHETANVKHFFISFID
jgi:hypothetical protein